MKKIFSIIVGLACCGSAAAQQTYTLDQLKQLAVENNYNLRSARSAIQQSKEQKSEAFTKYFPQLMATDGNGCRYHHEQVPVGGRSQFA